MLAYASVGFSSMTEWDEWDHSLSMAKPNESTRNAILKNIEWQTTKVRKTEILHAIIHTLCKLMFSNTTKRFKAK